MADDAKAQDQTEERQSRSEQAQQDEKEDQEATAKVEALEDDPPQDLADWPADKAKYKTFGGDDESYEDGPSSKLGPSGLRHHDDGSVSIDGEKVDDPDDYKGVPIPGGPTDPDTPKISGERDLTEKGQEQGSDEDD
jgi:hypothetical protein